MRNQAPNISAKVGSDPAEIRNSMFNARDNFPFRQSAVQNKDVEPFDFNHDTWPSRGF
jgi:hypothetical protein